jgi:hypothetical protein
MVKKAPAGRPVYSNGVESRYEALEGRPVKLNRNEIHRPPFQGFVFRHIYLATNRAPRWGFLILILFFTPDF